MDENAPITVTLPFGAWVDIDRALAETETLSARQANRIRDIVRAQTVPRIPAPQAPVDPLPQG